MRFLNLKDCEVKLTKGTFLGKVEAADAVQPNLNQVRLSQDLEGDPHEVPVHLNSLYESSSKHLTKEQKRVLCDLLRNYPDIFAKDDYDLGVFSNVKHKIATGQAKAIRQPVRRTPIGFQGEEDVHLQKLLDAGLVVPSSSEWASPVVLVRKTDGGVRWCIDYRKLNDVSIKDAYPLHRIEECLDTLSGATVFSALDLMSGYHQIEVDEQDRSKTAFVTKHGLYEYTRMPFGLCNSPSTFQRAMEFVLSGFQWSILLIYLDDVIIASKTFERYLTGYGY